MLPHVIVHAAISVDGRIDHFAGDIGLYYGLAAGFEVDAVLMGADTFLGGFGGETDPGDTAAPVDPAVDPATLRPLVVVDSQGRIPYIHRFQVSSYWSDLIVLAAASTPRVHLETLRRAGITVLEYGDDRVDLRAALEALGDQHGIGSVRIDSGGRLIGALLRGRLVAELSVLVTSTLVGGESPQSMFVASDLHGVEGVIPLRLTGVEKLNDGHVWLRYTVGDAG